VLAKTGQCFIKIYYTTNKMLELIFIVVVSLIIRGFVILDQFADLKKVIFDWKIEIWTI
jgi:hypothetical protein